MYFARYSCTRIICGRHLSLTVIQFVGKLNKLRQTIRERSERENSIHGGIYTEKHNGIEQKSINNYNSYTHTNNDQFIVVESTRMLCCCVFKSLFSYTMRACHNESLHSRANDEGRAIYTHIHTSAVAGVFDVSICLSICLFVCVCVCACSERYLYNKLIKTKIWIKSTEEHRIQWTYTTDWVSERADKWTKKKTHANKQIHYKQKSNKKI